MLDYFKIVAAVKALNAHKHLKFGLLFSLPHILLCVVSLRRCSASNIAKKSKERLLSRNQGGRLSTKCTNVLTARMVRPFEMNVQ